MKAIHYMIATLMLTAYSCVVMAFSFPIIEESHLSGYLQMPLEDLSTECQYSTLDLNDQPAMRGEDWQQTSQQMRTRMEWQRLTWQQRTLTNLRTVMDKCTQRLETTVKTYLQLYNHSFFKTLERPCERYVFATGHILA
ncbi:MAG: hypothetical protein J6K05_07440 [Bacteroidaceae bacterium]|nr:hypothetical protein [Bacteroidaceae bacterium]